jgi:peptide/nickel transport system permease protein
VSDVAATPDKAVGRGRRSELLTVLGRTTRTRRGMIGISLAALVVAIAVIGPLFAPYDGNALLGVPYGGTSSSHWLGTDTLGRDVLSRVLTGGWILLSMALAATALGVTVGTLAGVTAAYKGGVPDGLIMRPADVLLAFPPLVLALVLVSVVGAKLWLIVLAVAVSHAPQVARVMRAATLDVAERDFVKSAELTGLGSRRVIGREILPNLSGPLMVESGLRLTYSIVLIAGLSFLGFGQQAPAANWGMMMNENRPGLQSNALGVIAPAVLVAILTIGTNLFTDAVARASSGVLRGGRNALAPAMTGLPLAVDTAGGESEAAGEPA